jgi:hypothetical protein
LNLALHPSFRFPPVEIDGQSSLLKRHRHGVLLLAHLQFLTTEQAPHEFLSAAA